MVSKANTVLRRIVRSMWFFFMVESFLNSLAETIRLFALRVHQQHGNTYSASSCPARAMHFPEVRMIALYANMRKKWFRSFSILPGDQPAVVQENQSISRL